MSESRVNNLDTEEKVERSNLPTVDFGVHILPVSHNEFQARWTLSPDALESGRRAAAEASGQTHLVLRAYALGPQSKNSDFSSEWQDFSIEGTDNSAYFNLSTPANKINAVVGIMNKSGHFSPLARGQAVALPAAPKPAVPKPEPSQTRTIPKSEKVLNEAEISERLEAINGLPDKLKSKPEVLTHQPEAHEPAARPEAAAIGARAASTSVVPSNTLNEVAVLESVRKKMAAEPNPLITESEETPDTTETQTKTATYETETGGASEQLASQWEDIWSEHAPVELRAEFTLTGKIAPNMKLMIGGKIIEPTPGGYIVWKQRLNSFLQVWPLLDAALSSPSVPAGPSLEFFKNVKPSERLMELHASLEIEGKVSDPNYIEKLPGGLQVNAEGQFKLSRALPDGAVILPGLSLIAG